LSACRLLWHAAGKSLECIVIDPDGYRPNVGIVLMRQDGQIFWARRISRDGWQFPQGGMNTDETPEEAMYRELAEEVGLGQDDVRVLAATRGWLRYRLPRRCIRQHERPTCVGQKQVWFLLELLCAEARIRFDATDSPEFSEFRWVDFWYPLDAVVNFKRDVYARALATFRPIAEGFSGRPLPRPGSSRCDDLAGPRSVPFSGGMRM
jgi:putative (di)nucleoside polyphosphate hydrolase